MGWRDKVASKVWGAVRNKESKKVFAPHVGTLKKTRAVQDDLVSSIDEGRKIKGKEKVTEILMKQPHGKKLHELVKKSGDLHQKIHKGKK